MTTFPESTSNKNVPPDVFLVGEYSTMSGEILYTFYIDREGNMFKVTDWKMDKPYPFTFHQANIYLGLTPRMIEGMYNSWKIANGI